MHWAVQECIAAASGASRGNVNINQLLLSLINSMNESQEPPLCVCLSNTALATFEPCHGKRFICFVLFPKNL